MELELDLLVMDYPVTADDRLHVPIRKFDHEVDLEYGKTQPKHI